MHGHRSLVVVGGREHLLRLGRDGGVLLDQLGHHAAQGFDAQAQRGHVEQQHVLDRTAQHPTLNRGADRDGFIGVHVLARVLAEKLAHLVLHLGHPGLTANQQHVVDLADAQSGVLQRRPAGTDGFLDQIFHQRLQLGAGQLQIQMLGSAGVGGDIR